MALLKRQLHSHRAGPAVLGGDWWYLVFDTDTKRFYVEHQWGYEDVRPGDKVESGTVELEITAYLAAGEEGPGQRELARLIKAMFEDGANANRAS
jgi:hypothetical protein